MISINLISYSDPTGQYSQTSTAIQQLLNQAAQELSALIQGPTVTLDYAAVVDPTYTGYAKASTPFRYTPLLGGQIAISTGIAASKVTTGTDLNGSTADATLTFSTAFMSAAVAWMANPNDPVAATVYNVTLHEITHTFGFSGARNLTTGAITTAYQSAFDVYVTVDGGTPYFTGTNAVAILGTRVPLAPLGTASSIYHLDNQALSALTTDLMGPSSYPGASESDIDLAILKDLGFAISKTLTSVDGHTFRPGTAADTITGTATNDTAIYSGNRSAYTVTASGSGITVANIGSTADIDTFVGVERIQFSDQTYYLPSASPVAPLDDATSTQAIRAYLAYFGRPPDTGGLASWVTHLQNPANTINNMIEAFGNSNESLALYGNSNSTSKVTAIFHYLFGRDPLTEGLTFWSNAIDTGAMSMSSAALNILNGARLNDLTIVNQKIEAARSFVASIDTEWEVNLYKGQTAALNARKYLSTITADTTHNTEVVQLVGQVVDSLETGVDTLFANHGISLGYY